jgi:hypothetical protein
VIVIIGAVFVVKLLSRDSATPVKATNQEYPNSLSKTEQGNKPSSFLGGLIGGGNTPTPTPASSEDLSKELKDTLDDGGASEFDALEKDASDL